MTRFNSLESLLQKYTEAQVLAMIEKHLENRLAQSEYHKKYNARKTAQLTYIRANHPELLKEV